MNSIRGSCAAHLLIKNVRKFSSQLHDLLKFRGTLKALTLGTQKSREHSMYSREMTQMTINKMN